MTAENQQLGHAIAVFFCARVILYFVRTNRGVCRVFFFTVPARTRRRKIYTYFFFFCLYNIRVPAYFFVFSGKLVVTNL